MWLSACGDLQRNNPYDPSSHPNDSTALSLSLPLPKPLARVANRIEAVLEGPGMRTITTELVHTALGPANGTIGAIPPGRNRILTIRGYDLDGALLFSGQQRNITIDIGDTTRIRLTLELIGVIPDIPDPVEPDPVEPDPVEPDPVEPDPVEPDPVEPDPVEPDPVEPDPVEPDPVEPDPVEPDPVEPDPVEPDPVEPDPVEPDPVEPDPEGGETVPADNTDETTTDQ